MAYLIFIGITLALLTGFFALTMYEKRRGARFFAEARGRFDQKAVRISFILTRVDFAAFARDETHRVASRVGHDVAHFSLQVVRIIEQLLTRFVRHLRTHHSVEVAPRESARPFVKALSDFKDRLKATRPEVPDIQ